MQVRRGSVVLLNRFYWPDIAATAQMLTDLAEGLAAAGWNVTVITSATGYDSATAVEPTETRKGVRIMRVRGTSFGRTRLLARALDQGSYMLASAVRLLRIPRSDVVVAMSDPPLILPIAVATARVRGHAVVYWVQDLYPHLAARLGVLDERGLPYRMWFSLARWLYARCSAVVTLGPAMARTAIAAGAPPGRTIELNNWADTASVRPVPSGGNSWALANGLNEKFVVLYSGNAGLAHTFDTTIAAAERLLDDARVAFVFVGGGARLGELQRAAVARRLTNVRFLPYVPREQLAETLSAGSVGLVTEDPRVAGLLLPSKIYGILAAGRPVLFVGAADSDVAAIVRAAACGYVLDPADADGLVAAIRELAGSPERAVVLGGRARDAAEGLYSRERAVRRWDEVLSRVTESGREQALASMLEAAS